MASVGRDILIILLATAAGAAASRVAVFKLHAESEVADSGSVAPQPEVPVVVRHEHISPAERDESVVPKVQPPVPASAGTADTRLELAPSLEDSRQRQKAHMDSLMAGHATETVDASWSREMSASIKTNLSAISTKQGFSFGSPDCKMTSCTVDVTFENYESARKKYMDLLMHSGDDCAETIMTPEPANPDSPYSATLFLDCGNSRAKQ